MLIMGPLVCNNNVSYSMIKLCKKKKNKKTQQQQQTCADKIPHNPAASSVYGNLNIVMGTMVKSMLGLKAKLYRSM